MTRGKAAPRQHGTRAGYQQHIYRKEEPCEACLEASREATRARREANPGHKARAREYARIRNRALRRLTELHWVDFEVLLREERERAQTGGTS